MAAVPTFNSSGGGGGNSPQTHNHSHSANVLVIIGVAANTTSAPTSVTVDGNAATFIQGGANTADSFNLYSYWASGSGTSSIVATLAGARLCVASTSYTGTFDGAGNITSISSLGVTSGPTPLTITKTIAAGDSGRLLLSAGGSVAAANGSGVINIAHAGSETERKKQQLSGNTNAKAASVLLEDYDDSAAGATVGVTASKAGTSFTLYTVGFSVNAPAGVATAYRRSIITA
jgi:hypothetical protein